MDTNELNKLATHPLQTSYWGKFREDWGNEVLYTKYGLITVHRLPFTDRRIGMFIKGPVPTKTMLDDLKKIAKEKNLIFIKMEPNHAVTVNSEPFSVIRKIRTKKSEHGTRNTENSSDKLIKLLPDNGAVPGKTLFTPTTFWIDLTKGEGEMMKNFSSKTRYNIRYAQRKGVEVAEDNSEEAFERYLKLMRKTVERQGFYAHTEKYHRLMWKHFNGKRNTENGTPIARLLTAKYKKEILTTWIVFVWKDFLYYPYGASSMKHKNLQANSLMMWEAIRFGKKLGSKTFDLWGREPGKGFTKFKEGFNPQVIEFLGTWDLPVSSLYYPFRAADFLRWKYLRLKGKLRIAKKSF